MQVIHARDRTFGQTALYLAAKQGNEDAVATLLEAKAQPYIPDCKGLTPLHIAAYVGNVRSVLIDPTPTVILVTLTIILALNPHAYICERTFLGYL